MELLIQQAANLYSSNFICKNYSTISSFSSFLLGGHFDQPIRRMVFTSLSLGTPACRIQNWNSPFYLKNHCQYFNFQKWTVISQQLWVTVLRSSWSAFPCPTKWKEMCQLVPFHRSLIIIAFVLEAIPSKSGNTPLEEYYSSKIFSRNFFFILYVILDTREHHKNG